MPGEADVPQLFFVAAEVVVNVCVLRMQRQSIEQNFSRGGQVSRAATRCGEPNEPARVLRIVCHHGDGDIVHQVPLLKTPMNTKLEEKGGGARQVPWIHLSEFFIGLSIQTERDISLGCDEMPDLLPTPPGSR